MQSSRAPERPKALNWSSSPPLAVFVRNLQLLQLDRHDDWPSITVRSLSHSSQNQRQRVKAIEWALYQLVAIWDPETARDSVNLRAALFRVLSELKKNGELGRETILRKSMLENCKGDKFDEFLAGFSTAVLRKSLVDSSDDGLQNPAVKMSMSQGLTSEEHQNALSLILAHRVSLRSMGESRERVQSTDEKFTELLDRKNSQLDSRSEEHPPMDPDEGTNLDSLTRDIKANWFGSAEWLDTLLYGGARHRNDAFLELPFDAAWSKANESTVEDLSTCATPDLLVDLESRVSVQRARLNRWRQYGSSMQNHEHVKSSQSSKDCPIVFRNHQPLTVASISKAVRQSVERVSPKAEDRSLLFSLSEALARINGTPHMPGRTAAWRETGPRMPTEREASEPPKVMPSPPPVSETTTSQEESTSYGDTYHPKEDISSTPSPVVQVFPDPDPEPPTDRNTHTYTLVERTRKSMSLLPPPQSRSRESYHHRSRQSRKSFPVNQFETPQKQSVSAYHVGRVSTPQDELFKEEADYASVFKSRPRVAHSPIASPAVHFSPVDEFDLGNGDPSMKGEYDLAGVESPLYRQRP
ncbi:hypothetical protein EYZ11_003455 [Aspergillus tanneri]|uniref:HAUS augmin-like complex subunit 6 N-terminal domain-containing protein n=1 Tax=Aspergillus tanneri TaxID=1220188 RepID=A0A4S3JQE4_9EURO|nr:hypothetical protein EYZ11_003455 [Aspergillus tanneri]